MWGVLGMNFLSLDLHFSAIVTAPNPMPVRDGANFRGLIIRMLVVWLAPFSQLWRIPGVKQECKSALYSISGARMSRPQTVVFAAKCSLWPQYWREKLQFDGCYSLWRVGV